MKKRILAMTTLLCLSTGAYANASNVGCGLGTTLFGEGETTVGQIFIATTNGTSGNQTFGITSGTSNCSKPSSFVANDTLQNFVADNMDALAFEMAQGEGERLETLASLMGVSQKEQFKRVLSQNFAKIFTNENVEAAEVIDNIAVYV